MKIYVIRHGETDWNKEKLMQGISDIPLNETGINQAKEARKKIGDIKFDAVYASTLDRAITTASVIGGVDKSEVIQDERIIEVSFGKYEKKKYYGIGLPMMLHWAFPETIPAPKTVEKDSYTRKRAESFLADLKKNDYNSVLICSHGNFIRVFRHILAGDNKKATYKDFVENCELMEFEI